MASSLWMPPNIFSKLVRLTALGRKEVQPFGRPKHEIVLTIYKALISPTTCPPYTALTKYTCFSWPENPARKVFTSFCWKKLPWRTAGQGVTVILGETDHVGQILRTQLSTMGWLRAGKSEVCLKPRLLCPCLSPLFVWPEHWPQSILGGNVVFKSRCAKHKVGTMNEAQHQAPDSEQASLKRFVFQRRGQTSWLFFSLGWPSSWPCSPIPWVRAE